MVDEEKMTDMYLWSVNTGRLYDIIHPKIVELYNAFLTGKYSAQAGMRAFSRIVETGITMHNREREYSYFLSDEEKEMLASDMLDHYTRDFDLYPKGGYIT